MLPKGGGQVEPGSFEDWVYKKAVGIPLILSAAPTTAGGQLIEGQIGIFGSSLFWAINGTTYEIALVAT